MWPVQLHFVFSSSDFIGLVLVFSYSLMLIIFSGLTIFNICRWHLLIKTLNCKTVSLLLLKSYSRIIRCFNAWILQFYFCVQWDVACSPDSCHLPVRCSCFSYSASNIKFREALNVHNSAKISEGVDFLQRIWFCFETSLAFCICLGKFCLFLYRK